MVTSELGQKARIMRKMTKKFHSGKDQDIVLTFSISKAEAFRKDVSKMSEKTARARQLMQMRTEFIVARESRMFHEEGTSPVLECPSRGSVAMHSQ